MRIMAGSGLMRSGGRRLLLLAFGVACSVAFLVPPRVPGPSSGVRTVQEGPVAASLWRQSAWRGSRLFMAKKDPGEISARDFYDALKTFIETYEKKDMPEDFVVPFDAKRWPDRLHGVKLGKQYKRLIVDGEIKDDDVDLAERVTKELGVRIGLSDWERCLKALKAYKAIKGSLKVPSKYVVPNDDIWPEDVQGYRLGQRVSGIRNTGKFVEVRDEEEKARRLEALDDLGFEWKGRGKKEKVDVEELEGWYDQVVEGLEAYKRLVGDLDNIKTTFTIPNSPEWPEHLRGVPLGQKLNYIKTKSTILTDFPEKRDELAAMGVNLASRESQIEDRFQQIYLALQTFKALNGHVNVPQSFVVPTDDDRWAEEIRGMRLGIRVNAIRSQQTFIRNNPERRQMLEDLGLDTNPLKATTRKKLDKDYKYVDDDGVGVEDEERQSSGAEAWEEDDESGPRGSGTLPGSVEEPERRMTKEEILALQEKVGLEWFFVNKQPGASWFQKIEDLGLGNYPFPPLLTPEQHAKTKQKGEVAMRGNRINPTYVIQPPALKQHASEVECYPTGSLLDNLAEEAAALMDPDGDQVRVMGKLKEETRIVKIDYRKKLVPDADVDRDPPMALEGQAYWSLLTETTDGELAEFGEDGSFEDIIYALQVFKERYGHVNVPAAFEFTSPEDEDEDDEDWFRSWASRRELSDDFDPDAEPEFIDTAVSLSTMYDPQAAAAKRQKKLEKRPRLTGFFDDDDEDMMEGGALSFLDDDEDDEYLNDGEESGSGEPNPEDDDDVMWPESVLAMPLGDICWMLRSGVIAAKEVPERRAALDALGFSWEPEEMYVDLRWDVFLGTYYYWRLIKGLPLVPWDFIVPEEAPWPYFTRGVELGRLCNLIRQKQDIFMKYYPERCQTLEIFGWKWWWPTLDDDEMKAVQSVPQANGRFDNYKGLETVLDMKFIDPEETDLVTQPDWKALAEEQPESIPWLEQGHPESWDMNTHLPSKKKRRRRRSASETVEVVRRGGEASKSPSPRRRYFPLPGEKDAGDDKESNYEQQLREYLDE